ncbi:hypothetical protein CR513_61135, partial [Mucuna pruriens]
MNEGGDKETRATEEGTTWDHTENEDRRFPTFFPSVFENKMRFLKSGRERPDPPRVSNPAATRIKSHESYRDSCDSNYHCSLQHICSSMQDSRSSLDICPSITNNVLTCKGARMIIEVSFPKVFWTPCVHTLNLVLKNICAVKNIEKMSLITQDVDDVSFVMNFIINHFMNLAIFNHFSPLKLLAVAETHFAFVIVMLRRFKILKHYLRSMTISKE